jgi:hypothetical protein
VCRVSESCATNVCVKVVEIRRQLHALVTYAVDVKTRAITTGHFRVRPVENIH